MKIWPFILFIALAVSCKAKNHGPKETEASLKTAMQSFLYNAINNDSAKAKYRVMSVIYYEEKNEYVCEFNVHLKTEKTDTTGVMTANISKDFKKVDRTQ